MLSYGAEVNCSIKMNGVTPLHVALRYKREKEVIRALLEKGADVTVTGIGGESYLCFALEQNSSADVVQLLVDAGCSPDMCSLHDGCVLRCATEYSTVLTTPNKEVFRLLIKMKIDLNTVFRSGRSALCYVLRNGAELWVIDLLVAAGGSLRACRRHASPLHCATSNSTDYLRADVIEKLLKFVKDDDPVQLSDPTLLQRALRRSCPEKEAIKVLFDQLQCSSTVIDKCGNTLLHLAVLHQVSNPSIIEFLIESGVEVDLVNKEGATPLHLAVIEPNSSRSIVKILLKAGSSANAMNRRGVNPLQLFVDRMDFPFTEDVDILKMLFIAGSRIGNAAVRGYVGNLQYDKSEKNEFNYCNMLVKCYFLENPDFDIEHMIQGHPNYVALSAFGADCKRELHGMKSMIVGEGHTLQDLLYDRFSQLVEYDFNQLEIIAHDAFPVYFDIIATKIIGTLAIEEILGEVHMFTSKYISGQKEMVVLNYNVVCSIADRLTDDDLLRFILAFRKVDPGAM